MSIRANKFDEGWAMKASLVFGISSEDYPIIRYFGIQYRFIGEVTICFAEGILSSSGYARCVADNFSTCSCALPKNPIRLKSTQTKSKLIRVIPELSNPVKPVILRLRM